VALAGVLRIRFFSAEGNCLPGSRPLCPELFMGKNTMELVDAVVRKLRTPKI